MRVSFFLGLLLGAFIFFAAIDVMAPRQGTNIIWMQGILARRYGMPKNFNPHPWFSRMYWEWEEGWEHENKKTNPREP